MRVAICLKVANIPEGCQLESRDTSRNSQSFLLKNEIISDKKETEGCEAVFWWRHAYADQGFRSDFNVQRDQACGGGREGRGQLYNPAIEKCWSTFFIQDEDKTIFLYMEPWWRCDEGRELAENFRKTGSIIFLIDKVNRFKRPEVGLPKVSAPRIKNTPLHAPDEGSEREREWVRVC